MMGREEALLVERSSAESCGSRSLRSTNVRAGLRDSCLCRHGASNSSPPPSPQDLRPAGVGPARARQSSRPSTKGASRAQNPPGTTPPRALNLDPLAKAGMTQRALGPGNASVGPTGAGGPGIEALQQDPHRQGPGNASWRTPR